MPIATTARRHIKQRPGMENRLGGPYQVAQILGPTPEQPQKIVTDRVGIGLDKMPVMGCFPHAAASIERSPVPGSPV
jgi:hypothetical protein